MRSYLVTPRIVPRRSVAAQLGLTLIGILFAGIASWMVFELGREWGGYAEGAAERSAKRLKEKLSVAEDERDRFRQRVAVLERTGQVDREASRLAQAEIRKLQGERLEMAKEVEFLRGLVADGAHGALRINELKLIPTDDKGVVGFRFTVTQLKKDFGTSQGKILLSVDGTQAGDERHLSHEEVADGGGEGYKMRFRHFQNVSGRLRFPDGFIPESLTVEVSPTTEKLAPLRESFEWTLGE